MTTKRFQDEKKRLSDFYDEVWVVCPSCGGKAVASVNADTKVARLLCLHCAYFKEVDIAFGTSHIHKAAHAFFDAELWLQAPFKDSYIWAYNLQHLSYLESYIAADLRESLDRDHFTLLEKLPKFIHSAKNREALLKVIARLKNRQ